MRKSWSASSKYSHITEIESSGQQEDLVLTWSRPVGNTVSYKKTQSIRNDHVFHKNMLINVWERMDIAVWSTGAKHLKHMMKQNYFLWKMCNIIFSVVCKSSFDISAASTHHMWQTWSFHYKQQNFCHFLWLHGIKCVCEGLQCE